jgi:hypothetical protein
MLREDRFFVVVLILGSLISTLLIAAIFSCASK